MSARRGLLLCLSALIPYFGTTNILKIEGQWSIQTIPDAFHEIGKKRNPVFP